MDKILDLIKSPIFWIVFSLVSGIILRRIADKWKALIYFLTAQIEVFDDKVSDIIPEEYRKKITKIKRMVAHNISRDMKKKLDAILEKQGFKRNFNK